jgi:hypothetical protein
MWESWVRLLIGSDLLTLAVEFPTGNTGKLGFRGLEVRTPETYGLLMVASEIALAWRAGSNKMILTGSYS